jgi:hypothetical protein
MPGGVVSDPDIAILRWLSVCIDCTEVHARANSFPQMRDFFQIRGGMLSVGWAFRLLAFRLSAVLDQAHDRAERTSCLPELMARVR